MHMARLAALQMTSCPEVTANLAAAGHLLEEAAASGADLAVLPENFAFLGLADADKRRIAEPEGDGPIQGFLADIARRLGIWVVGGTIPLQLPSEPRVAAACLVYDTAGRLAARYDKIHLFDVSIPAARELPRISEYLAGKIHENRRYAHRPARLVGLL